MTRHAAAQHLPRAARGHRRRLLLALLVVPLLFGALAVPAVAPGPVQGDELSNAQAQQRDLARKIREQKALIASLNNSQAALSGKIASTKSQIEGFAEDLSATRKRVAALTKDIAKAQAAYDVIVTNLADLDAQLLGIEREEAAKKLQLRERKAELSDRIRQANEAERTSMLETFLSGAKFTDMLAEMSTQLDAAEQDRALAQQIALDRETLLSLHRTVETTRGETNTLRQAQAVQKQKLDRRMGELRDEQARLKRLEKAAKAALAAQKARYAKLARDEARLRKALAATAAARRKLERRIDRLVAAQANQGNIPSRYNGTLRWPMPGVITQHYGCTGFSWEPPSGGCAHFHNGIDIVNAYGTPVRASGAGRIVYCGWNYADGADPAWIVIIAHSSNLTTWYAHLTSGCPATDGLAGRQGPGHRPRGEHRALDGRPPPLDGRVQRIVRQPPAVHLARPDPTGSRGHVGRC